MTEVPFYATRMGRTYYEHSVPELVRQLKRIGDGLERLIELQESPGQPASDTTKPTDKETDDDEG